MLNLVLSLAASTALVLVCAATAVQLRRDRPAPQPRHRPAPRPVLALPAAPVRKPEPVFDPLSKRTPLAEVERFLADLGVADWCQPLTPFEERAGVLPISAPPAPAVGDTRELEPIA